MYRLFILIAFIGLTIIACKQDGHNRMNLSPKTSLPEGFDAFYQRFHSDTGYQKAHILFPLPGRPSSMDTTINYQGGDYYWQEKDWKFHRPFDPESGFEREFEVISDQMVNEIYEHHALPMTMLRRFARSGDDWRLIFYAAPGQ